jgi:hypothetical protein
MPSFIRACDGSAGEPDGKTKWRKKGNLLDKLENGISPSAVEHDDGVKGEKKMFHQEKCRGRGTREGYRSIESEISWQVVVTPSPTKKDSAYLKMRRRKDCQSVVLW